MATHLIVVGRVALSYSCRESLLDGLRAYLLAHDLHNWVRNYLTTDLGILFSRFLGFCNAPPLPTSMRHFMILNLPCNCRGSFPLQYVEICAILCMFVFLCSCLRACFRFTKERLACERTMPAYSIICEAGSLVILMNFSSDSPVMLRG